MPCRWRRFEVRAIPTCRDCAPHALVVVDCDVLQLRGPRVELYAYVACSVSIFQVHAVKAVHACLHVHADPHPHQLSPPASASTEATSTLGCWLQGH